MGEMGRVDGAMEDFPNKIRDVQKFGVGDVSMTFSVSIAAASLEREPEIWSSLGSFLMVWGII